MGARFSKGQGDSSGKGAGALRHAQLPQLIVSSRSIHAPAVALPMTLLIKHIWICTAMAGLVSDGRTRCVM